MCFTLDRMSFEQKIMMKKNFITEDRNLSEIVSFVLYEVLYDMKNTKPQSFAY
jgi:hypothetical protein